METCHADAGNNDDLLEAHKILQREGDWIAQVLGKDFHKSILNLEQSLADVP